VAGVPGKIPETLAAGAEARRFANPILPMTPRLTTSKAETKRCDLCGGTEFQVIGRQDRRGQRLDTGICTRCGLVVHVHVPSERQLDEFYATRYRQEYHGETTPSPRRVMRAWRNGQRIQRQLSPFVRPAEEIFEVGAGIGCTLKAFELAGHRASGIEPGGGFCGYSREQLCADVRGEYLFDLPRRPLCDVLLLVHVIEHFRSPKEALYHMHHLVRPDGKLYVECPNLAAPFARPGKLFHYAHIHNFTPDTLAMLAERCGFRMIRRLSADDDPNLQMLFIRQDIGSLCIDPSSYRRTRRALERYGTISYHLRWSYLRARAAKLGGYLAERRYATRVVAELIERCQKEAAGEKSPAGRYRPKAA